MHIQHQCAWQLHNHVKLHCSSPRLHREHKCAWQLHHHTVTSSHTYTTAAQGCTYNINVHGKYVIASNCNAIAPGCIKNITVHGNYASSKQNKQILQTNNGNYNNNVLFANDNRQNKTKEATTPVNNCWEILLVYFPSTNTHSNAFPRQANRTFAAWLEVVTRTINCVYMRHTEEKRKMCEEKVRCTSYKSTFPCTIINLGDQTSRLSNKSLPRKPA